MDSAETGLLLSFDFLKPPSLLVGGAPSVPGPLPRICLWKLKIAWYNGVGGWALVEGSAIWRRTRPIKSFAVRRRATGLAPPVQSPKPEPARGREFVDSCLSAFVSGFGNLRRERASSADGGPERT